MSGRRISELATATAVARTDLIPIVDLSGTPTTRRATLALLAGLPYLWTVNERTASYTLTGSDAGRVVEMDVASANGLTVPPASSVAWETGTVILVTQTGTGTTTLVEGAGVTIETPSTLGLAGQWATVLLRYQGSDVWVATGDLDDPLMTPNVQADDYTLALTDAFGVVEMNKATAVNLTVPPDSAVPFPIGTVVEVAQVGAGQVTIVEGSGVDVRTPETLDLTGQWSTVSLRKRAADEWLLAGDVETA